MTDLVDDTYSTRRIQLDVGGMTCGACAARVERKLNKIDGVRASVNYATRRATVELDSHAGVADAIDAVHTAGYSATELSEQAPPVNEDAATAKALFTRLIVALALFVPLANLSVVLAVIPDLRFPGWQAVLVALAAPVVTYCAWPFYRTAVRTLRTGVATMDTLVSLGVLAATALSMYSMFSADAMSAAGQGVWSAIFSSDSIYLEVAAGVTVFVLAGRYYEARARTQAVQALSALAALRATEARVECAGGTSMLIPLAELKVGQRLIVLPGETIPSDGHVIEGTASVDLSAMTGETTPVQVSADHRSTAVGGTTCLDGRLRVEVTAVGDDTRLAEMIALVDSAQMAKARAQRVADRIAAIFVPCVIALAVSTVVGWSLTGASWEHAVSAAVAVLVIACPCALGLAMPMALVIATGRGAQLGIFLKGHSALELSGTIDVVVFDKTGTLTNGRPQVSGVYTVDNNSTELILGWAATLEQHTSHPIATAIAAAAGPQSLPAPVEVVTDVGSGVRGVIDGLRVQVGSPTWIARTAAVPAALDAQRADVERSGGTAVYVAVDDAVRGLIDIRDSAKPSARQAVDELHRMGLRTLLVTGDNAGAAQRVAEQVGIDDVTAGVLPAEKVAIIDDARRSGACVAMVGDGINDGPALASADLGIAIGGGTDVAIGAADIVLVRDDLTTVALALHLASATRRTMRTNLAWAFGYNIAALPLAAAGLLNPLIAGAAMALSSFFVVSNSLRLQNFARVDH